MITFEDILPHLCELFIEKLPLYIEEINKIHNDGLIIHPFENKTLFENCQKLPCFKFELLEAEYSEKDRIIENTVFKISLELILPQEIKKKTIFFWRYAEAIQKILEESESSYIYKMIKIIESKIIIEITLCR